MVLEIIFFTILCFCLIATTIIVFNLFTAPRFSRINMEKAEETFVSVLIPARNEEKNIGKCLNGILNQTYSNYEVIVLDDSSDDETFKVAVDIISQSDVDARINKGKPLPKNWIGKNWACHQLANEAKGEFLLFLDADVLIENHVLSSSVNYINKYNLQLLTCFPTQIMKSFGEWFVVPLVNFLLLTFLPLRKVYSSPQKSFVAANGQYLLISREAYNRIGSHEAVSDEIVEDMEIARRVKSHKYNMMTLLGDDSVKCRMYSGLKSSFMGFTKNFYSGFNISAAKFILLIILIFFIFLAPFPLLFLNSIFVWIVIVLLLGRILVSIISAQNFLYNALLHPIQMIIMFIIGLNSVYQTKVRKLTWKGRYI